MLPLVEKKINEENGCGTQQNTLDAEIISAEESVLMTFPLHLALSKSAPSLLQIPATPL